MIPVVPAGKATRIESRILILAPTANDARLTARFLESAGMTAEICSDTSGLCLKVEEGCAALLLAEETLTGKAVAPLVEVLSRQPAWSDIPISIITSGGEVSQARLHRLGVFGSGGNVTVLERPFRPATLVSTITVALRARARQYEVRGLLRELKAGEERLQGILDSISDAFISIDRDWRINYVNPSYVRLVAPIRSADEVVGQNLWEAFPDLSGTEVGRFYRRMMEGTETESLEVFYAPLEAWLEVRAFPSQGGLSLFIQNITERKRRESEVARLTQEIQSQAKLFDATLSNIPDLAYSFDPEGRVIYANKALLTLWGKTLAEVVGKNVFDLKYPAELAEKLHGQLRQVVETGRPIRDETLFRTADGREDIHDYIFNPVFAEDDRVAAVAGTTRLVTEHRKAEGALRQLAAIVQGSEDAIISKDLNGIITSWNAGAEHLFGYSAEEIVGRSIIILIPGERHNEATEILGKIRRAERIAHFETIRRRKDGSNVPVSLSVSPIKDREGNIVGASKIARDITQQKEIENALKEAKDAAEAANRSKDHFLAVLSHELRTPLTPVLMMASALEMDPMIPPSLRGDMAVIRRNVELETKLIDDLLDLSRITTGKLALHRRMVAINEAVGEVCAICESQIRDKKMRLEIDLDAEAGHVRADPARVQQILWNVIKNAAKFTPEGGNIRVATRRKSKDVVEIVIADDGIGIDAKMLSRIFDAFEQGNERVTRQFGGLGLGLAITNALVGLHDGRIRAESEGEGRGSTFFIELPVTAPEGMLPGDPSPAGERHGALRVLVVEDHADTGTMLARVLKSSGFDVEVATSVASAIGKAEKQAFDFVISDLGLPDASGYDLIRSLRERHPAIRGIAMSGYGMEEDIRKSLAAGFSEHLVKPVNLLSLEQAIRRHAPRN